MQKPGGRLRRGLGAKEGAVGPCEWGRGADWLGEEEADSGALGERLMDMEELGERRVLLDED